MESKIIDRIPAASKQGFSGIDPGCAILLEEDFNCEPQDTPVDRCTDKCLHHVFETQAGLTPHAIAVICGEQQLTYAELDARANRLARYLQRLGVGRDVLAALCLERSVELIIGLMGILKAGGGYVPLDATQGKERLARILRAAQPRVILTQQRFVGQLRQHRAEIVCVDEGWEQIGSESEERPDEEATPENVAYVIFTSGSTGAPKGVVIEHRQIFNYVKAIWQRCSFEPGLHFAMVQPLSVDSSQTVLFPSLLSGGCLHIVTRDQVLEPQALNGYFSRWPADVLKIAPSHLAALMTAPHPEQILPRRWLILGGEACRKSWAEEVQALASCSLVNHYGPTETTVGVLAHTMNMDERNRDCLTVPIGRPLLHTQAFLLDESLQPVADGTPGNLYIAGRGLARCYLGQPEMTAEKFVPNPSGQEPGARLYKTGDVARRLPDGNIEFLGRSDDQVKIRGFRVELGEIEAALVKYPAIRQAVVLPRENQIGDKRLVAYVVPAGPLASLSEVREFLKAKLPDYMMPSTLVPLAALPLTSQGKIDRLALPSADQLVSEKPLADFQTPIEEVVAGIWSEILGAEKVSRYDNFFDLGGHSLKAIQIVAAVRETFRTELPLRILLETPTMSAFAAEVEAALRLSGPSFQARWIERTRRDTEHAVSFSQERAWFIHQLQPHNLAYNSQIALWLKGRLDVAALERSLNEIVRRHEIYRTTFPAMNGRPVQLIHEAEPVRLPIVNIEGPPGAGEAEARRLILRELRTPFDLTRLPLVRWKLLRISADSWVLLHVEHHLVHDGWSIHVFLRELMELYKALAAGNPSPLPELPIQFVDFAQWQRHWLKQPEAEEQLAYWKKTLAGAAPVLNLPTDRPRPTVQNFRGAQEKVEIPSELAGLLRARSRQEHATLFMTMLTAFLALLHRYTDQNDICVGSGVANRGTRETESLIGMIVNNIVLRTDLSGDPTWRELLVRVRRVALEAYARQDIPFDKVVEAVRPKRDLSHNPLFQVMFNFQDTPLPELEFPGLSAALDRPLSNGSAKFDLNVVIYPRSEQCVGTNQRTTDDKIVVMWEYSTDLFNQDMIRRTMARYKTFLEHISTAPEQRISRAPLLLESERHRMLIEWNATETDYPKEEALHQLFEEQVKRNPDAIAVVLSGKQLTYRELNRRANQLAHHLRKLGIGAEVLVGICMERSLEMIIALLGVLKAGGAYVPLDPTYPKNRLEFIVANTRISLILTQRHLIGRLPENSAYLMCDAASEAIAAENEDNPVSATTSDNLAYVIYTSGSTGRPKGVGVTHRGVVRLVQGANYADLTDEDVFLQFAPLAFDASTFEIWGCLLNGGRLIVFPPYTPSLEDLANEVSASGVTVLWLTSALFNAMVDADTKSLNKIKQLLVGGEVLSVSHVRRFLEQLPNCRLTNGYGPTESTTFACCYPITPKEQLVGSVPIGRPIANTEAYVLDDHLNPVPAGVAGELHVGGAGLARGYFDLPALTAQKFVPHPFSEEPGARLYRTGDRVRYLADGNIEFLGRMDHQVKIRGFRVELEEIEAVVKEHHAVREAAVLVREESPGEKRLVGYITCREPLEIGTLRDFAKAKLPEYMVPSAFVLLDSLPLMASGKLDRQGLPAPGANHRESKRVFVAPRTRTEALIGRIWAEVLKLDEIGVHDDFFELGGHSLLATQIVSRLRDDFRVAVPLRLLFQCPTVAALANQIDSLLCATKETEEMSELEPEAREELEI
jgi:amino acid adenylation domain-containing protein